MNRDAESIIEILTGDEDLCRAVRSAVTPEQVVEVLSDAGLAVTLDDVVMAATGSPELSDAELDMVAGGTSPFVSVDVVCQPSPPSANFVFGQCIP